MAYSQNMIFIETTIFTKQIMELLTDLEYRELQNELLLNPKSGAVVQGGGGYGLGPKARARVEESG